jgi:hypothetical protein
VGVPDALHHERALGRQMVERTHRAEARITEPLEVIGDHLQRAELGEVLLRPRHEREETRALLHGPGGASAAWHLHHDLVDAGGAPQREDVQA